MTEELLEHMLGFVLEERVAGTWILQYSGDGCRPATEAEIKMWHALLSRGLSVR